MAAVPVLFWILFVWKKIDATSAQITSKITFKDDKNSTQVGDWCDAGLEDFR